MCVCVCVCVCVYVGGGGGGKSERMRANPFWVNFYCMHTIHWFMIS